MMRSCCGSPRLMPYGMGGRNPQQTCSGPCNNKPCNVMMKHPACSFPIPPWPRKEIPSPPPIPQCTLAPINVNLQMCKMDQPSCQEESYENDCSGQQQGYQSYLKTAACGPPEEEERPRRCPDGNFVVKVESMRPEVVFKPNLAVFDGQTSYKSFYVPKAFDRSKSYKPKVSVLKNVGVVDGESVYKMQYVPHPTIPYKKPEWAKAEEFNPPHGVMIGTTTYNSAYNGTPGDPAKTTRRYLPFDPTRGPLDDRTTHKLDYIPFCNVQRARSYAPAAEANLRLCHCAPFRGDTTYHSDFTPKSGGTRKSFKRLTVPSRSQKFSHYTTYNTSYEPFYYTNPCEPCMPGEIYDQLYPKHPCACVNCCPPLKRYDGPPTLPIPPCQQPCPPPDPCDPPVDTCQLPFKMTIKNEDSPFDPTTISIEPNQNCAPCLNF